MREQRTEELLQRSPVVALEQLGGQKTYLACQLCTRPLGSELTPTLNAHMAEAHPEGATSLREMLSWRSAVSSDVPIHFSLPAGPVADEGEQQYH